MTAPLGPLSWILLWPIIGIAFIFLTPKDKISWIRWIANIMVFLSFALALEVFFSYDRTAGGYQFIDKIPWVKPLGISYHVGVDGINSVLVLLQAFCSLAGILVTRSIKERVKEYYILYLMLIIGVYGVFLSLDLFFLYFFYEMAVMPVYLLIGVWGSTDKEYATMKLTLYLTGGAVLALIALLALYAGTGLGTFDLVAIQQHLAANPLSPQLQNWIFPVIVVGFGVIVTLWPFYTWSPVGYAAAPTSVSMLHAGVLKKLGAYAILRLGIQLMPQAAQIWMPWVATLAVLNILYCGLISLTQKDMKFILGYSSCSHMGYILLGLACLNTIGLNGVVFLIFAHGIMAALGFALVGAFYDQTHTRNLDDLGGLAKRMPFVATCFTMAAMASAGLPGFANFIAEVMILLGAWDKYRWQAILAVLGIVVTAVYMLKAVRLVFHGPLPAKWTHVTDAKTIFQRLPYALLILVLLAVGFWPSLILRNIEVGTKPILEQLEHQSTGTPVHQAKR
ncbi:MAG: NADH-quinone oxidoreductase subunit M [Candidatus Omnitrophica bacterium]|nr:NADH-quinone oxidoreductase subunit M [Candidatus Omnitrophota bacterium]